MLYEEPVEIHCITKMWTTRNKITVKKKKLGQNPTSRRAPLLLCHHTLLVSPSPPPSSSTVASGSLWILQVPSCVCHVKPHFNLTLL